MELFGHVHCRHVWRQKMDAYKEKHLIPTVKYSGGSVRPVEAAPSTKNRGANNCDNFIFIRNV